MVDYAQNKTAYPNLCFRFELVWYPLNKWPPSFSDSCCRMKKKLAYPFSRPSVIKNRCIIFSLSRGKSMKL